MDFGTIFVNSPGNLVYVVTWDPKNGQMDSGSGPDINDYIFFVDGSPRPIATLTWQGLDEMEVTAVGAAAVTSMSLRLDTVDPTTRNTDLVIADAPQQVTTSV